MIKTYLQTNNDWDLDVKILSCIDNAFGDNITSHDTSEDVHQYGCHFRIRKDDSEGFLQ